MLAMSYLFKICLHTQLVLSFVLLIYITKQQIDSFKSIVMHTGPFLTVLGFLYRDCWLDSKLGHYIVSFHKIFVNHTSPHPEVKWVPEK